MITCMSNSCKMSFQYFRGEGAVARNTPRGLHYDQGCHPCCFYNKSRVPPPTIMPGHHIVTMVPCHLCGLFQAKGAILQPLTRAKDATCCRLQYIIMTPQRGNPLFASPADMNIVLLRGHTLIDTNICQRRL